MYCALHSLSGLKPRPVALAWVGSLQVVIMGGKYSKFSVNKGINQGGTLPPKLSEV